jgi:orotidine-5'-phosphate decarboxylase
MRDGPDFRRQLVGAQAAHASMLCVGLDPEPARFPGAWKDDPARIFDFCAAIVDATHDLVCAFKPQVAYFGAQRAEAQLERLIAHIRQVAPGVPVILDAKRGDIGSTAEQYAREAFERYQADAVTLSPFMGFDSIEPYMRYSGRGLILLCRTSNPGGSDLQAQRLEGGALLYEHIARLAAGEWNRGGQLALVVGATFPRELARVRELAPTLPLLIPGVGAQGGDAEATVRAGWRPGAPIIVSSSRAVLYAGTGTDPGAGRGDGTGARAGTGAGIDFASAARRAAMTTRDQLQRARPAP